MNVLSYRGPGCAGGVSGSLWRTVQKLRLSETSWWHIADNAINRRIGADTRKISELGRRVLDGHYRYCNNFLWPIMHDLPEYAIYSRLEKECYQKFNLAFGKNVSAQSKSGAFYFVQDYQLAMLPSLLTNSKESRCNIFWHIPWPATVHEDHIQEIAEIARHLLAAEKIGFHIEEYARNFLSFVEKHLVEYEVSHATKTVSYTGSQTIARRSSKVVVQALGLDNHFWTLPQYDKQQMHSKLFRSDRPIVLSVDRADYTKGVLNRLQSIETFFLSYPEMLRELTFVQICQQSRPGLKHFDEYWQECLKTEARIKRLWDSQCWTPLIWIKDSIDSSSLLQYYSRADLMLVNPLRDGLNLTAKEYSAAGPKSGLLLLSEGAGVYHELGKHAVAVHPQDTSRMAEEIYTSLSVSQLERTRKMQQLKSEIWKNPLIRWWDEFTQGEEEAAQTCAQVRKQGSKTTISKHYSRSFKSSII